MQLPDIVPHKSEFYGQQRPALKILYTGHQYFKNVLTQTKKNVVMYVRSKKGEKL